MTNETPQESPGNDAGTARNAIDRRDILFGGVAASALLLAGQFPNEAQASVLSKAQRTSETMEPALVWPGQEDAAQKKLDGAAQQDRQASQYCLAGDRRHGLRRSRLFRRRRGVGAATPNMDRLAREGLEADLHLFAADLHSDALGYSDRTSSRSHGPTRPILAGDKITKNPWADETSLPKLLGDAGYRTVLSGKWHVGESEGMRPHDVGFDEFYGFYEAEKEISQPSTNAAIPTSCSIPNGSQMLRRPGRATALVHGFKGGADRRTSRRSTVSRRWPKATAW